MKFIFIILLVLSSFSVSSKEKKILALGDSLTEGYGIRPNYSYPTQLEQKLKKSGKNYKVLNGGISGSTTASGLSRLKWFLKAKPDIVIVALGANDGLRGLDINESKKNLEKIIIHAKEKGLIVILAGMQMPPNYGAEYRDKFKSIFFELSKKHKLPMIPFLLEGIAGNKKLNIEDGIHPNKEGYKVMVENVYKVLKEHL